jgi:hypothetical protein
MNCSLLATFDEGKPFTNALDLFRYAASADPDWDGKDNKGLPDS